MFFSVLVTIFIVFNMNGQIRCQLNDRFHISYRNFVDQEREKKSQMVHVITPTYVRSTQQPDMTRLAQTLRGIKRLHWIVVEDSKNQTGFVADLLRRSDTNYTHLNIVRSKDETKVSWDWNYTVLFQNCYKLLKGK